jgi:hypothetical protein
MSPLLILLAACNPQDLTVTDASYFVWLADSSSSSLEDGSVKRSELSYVDCGSEAECQEDSDGNCEVDGSGVIYPGCPSGFNPDNYDPEYFSWFGGDAYYLAQGKLDPWRAEALLTNEGDFQITLHHDLGQEDFRFAFVIDPNFEPSVCIQEGQSCFTLDDPANPQDSDGDGWADYYDPDCLYGSWEVGFAPNACNNGIDDDGDGVIDGDDPGCEHAFDTAEAQVSDTCRDNVDNDSDGWIDEEDPDCFVDGEEEDARTNHLYACSDLEDNDGDGVADGEHANKQGDPGCDGPLDNLEDGPQDSDPCDDGYDNDGDGWIDDDDVDCLLGDDEHGLSAARCNDGIDNDDDGLIDADDPGCLLALDANEEDMVVITVVPEDTGIAPYDVFACDDGLDNDGDGWVDTDDPDCIFGVDEDDSYFGLTECNNGVVDDPGDPNESCEPDTKATEECNNEDDDCDGEIDEGLTDCVLDLCNLLDDDGDGKVDEDQDCDASDSDCRTGMDNLESDIPSSSCKNTDENNVPIDDDGDGWANEEDPDCLFGLAEVGFSAFTCNDGLDNDDDGGIDGGVAIGYDLIEIPSETEGEPSTYFWEIAYGAADSGCGAAMQWTETPTGGMSTCLDTECEADTTGEYVDGCARDEDGLIIYYDVDNDGDGWANFDDMDCVFGRGEAVNQLTNTQCSDLIDNDGDGLIDADDESCMSGLGTHELTNDTCVDGLDNDGDGWIDTEDGDCNDGDIGYERGFAVTLCNDNVDNDGDGLIDAEDDGCESYLDPFEEGFNQCTDGEDNDNDGYIDAVDPDCAADTPFEDNTIFGVYACNDGVDNDNDDLIDYYDTDCESAYDNDESTPVVGDPVPFYLDNHPVIEAWSADEEGYSIWYINAGSYQLNPYNEQDYWTLPKEWRSGFATSKFASEEFLVESQEFQYFGMNYEDPDYQALAYAAEAVTPTYEGYFDEPCEYGFADYDLSGGDAEAKECGFTMKVESNSWRPVDIDSAGLDNWIEAHHSWVRLENVDGAAPVIEVGGTVKGDFQLYLGGYESASGMIVRGSFEVNNIRKDRWGYDDLEAEKFEESGKVACEY